MGLPVFSGSFSRFAVVSESLSGHEWALDPASHMSRVVCPQWEERLSEDRQFLSGRGSRVSQGGLCLSFGLWELKEQ